LPKQANTRLFLNNCMRILVPSFLFAVIALTSHAQQAISLPLLYHKDKIFVCIPTLQGDTLHFMFDTGSRDMFVDSAVAVKYQLINEKSSNSLFAFAKNIYLPGKFFRKQGLFSDTILNKLYPLGQSVNLSKLKLSSDIKIDGILGISPAMEKHTIRIDFANNIVTIADSTTHFDIKKTHHSVDMLYSDNGFETKRSAFSKIIPAGKFLGYYGSGYFIETNLIFDTGCHWEAAIITLLPLDSVYTHKPARRNSKIPHKYYDKQENIDYLMANSLSIAGQIIVKKVKTVYLKSYLGDAFGSLPSGILIGAPFFKRFKQVYFNFPAKRIDFVK
jgi:hypothetical protein